MKLTRLSQPTTGIAVFLLLVLLSVTPVAHLSAQPGPALQSFPNNSDILVSQDIINQYTVCAEIPCSFVSRTGEDVNIDGNLTQSPDYININTDVSIDGTHNGHVHVELYFSGSTAQVTGLVVREENNFLSLPGFIKTLGNVEIALKSSHTDYTSLTPTEAAILVLTLLFPDIPSSTSEGGDGPPAPVPPGLLPDRIRTTPLALSGPVTGLLIVPLPPTVEQAECGIVHDLCLENGGNAAAINACNQAFFECIRRDTPFFSIIYTEIVLALIDGLGPSGGGGVDCQCNAILPLSRASLSLLRTVDYDRIRIGNSWCRVNACTGPCFWTFDKRHIDPETGRPFWVPVMDMYGKCGPSPSG